MTFALIHDPYRTPHAMREQAVKAKPIEQFPLRDDPTVGAI